MRGFNSVKPARKEDNGKKQMGYEGIVKYYGTGITENTAANAYAAFRRPPYAGTIAEVKHGLE